VAVATSQEYMVFGLWEVEGSDWSVQLWILLGGPKQGLGCVTHVGG